MAKKLDQAEVLNYSLVGRRASTVRRHYAQWRMEQGIPTRCDKPDCHFHLNQLVWRGKKLPLILDHIDGASSNNRPKNLQYLCPNCDALQAETRGGANIGRIEHHSGGYIRTDRKTGLRHHRLIAETGRYSINEISNSPKEIQPHPTGSSKKPM